jgi:hypothetical protein
VHACDHDHEHDKNCQDPPASTGFLPISLALGLFITGLFVLDLDLGCGSPTASSSNR